MREAIKDVELTGKRELYLEAVCFWWLRVDCCFGVSYVGEEAGLGVLFLG